MTALILKLDRALGFAKQTVHYFCRLVKGAKIADSFAKQAKDFDPDVIEAFDEIVHMTLHRHTDAVDPFK